MSLRKDVARQAFVWGLPTVTLYGVLHELVLSPGRDGHGTRLNRVLPGPVPADVADVACLSEPPRPGTSSFCAWLDLRRGPVHLSVPPDAVGGPAYATLFDLYAEVVGQVPERLDPSGRAFLLAGPSWEPAVPPDVVAVLRCETDLCLTVGHDRSDEYPARSRPRREDLVVRPVDEGTDAPLPLPPPVPPVDVRRPPTVAFLTVLDWMLALMPTRPGEEDLRAELEVVGVACGPAALDDAIAEDRLDGHITEGLRQGFEDVRQGVGTHRSDPLLRR